MGARPIEWTPFSLVYEVEQTCGMVRRCQISVQVATLPSGADGPSGQGPQWLLSSGACHRVCLCQYRVFSRPAA